MLCFMCVITDRGLPFDFTALLTKPTGILTECITTINLFIALYRAFDYATLLKRTILPRLIVDPFV